jgi:Ca2+-binding EF-hand superfamily protein
MRCGGLRLTAFCAGWSLRQFLAFEECLTDDFTAVGARIWGWESALFWRGLQMATHIRAASINEADVDKLWQAFGVFDADGNGEISVDELASVMQSLGQKVSPKRLRSLIKEVDLEGSGTINFDEFKALMIAHQGDPESRLRLAFAIFDQDGNGRITTAELHSVMSRFGLGESELEAMIQEVDLDGDGSIDFDEFCQLVPDQEPVDHPKVDLAPAPAVPAVGQAKAALPIPAGSASKDSATPEPVESPELQRLRALLARHPQNERPKGTSLLQMQIGLFRLIQGAAYRCFRESFSANHETHLQVRNLPYRITDFVGFVDTAITLYKGLGLVDPQCEPLLDAVVASIHGEVERLQERIENWASVEKTPAMLAEAEVMRAARSKSGNAREKFAAGVEFAITMTKQRLCLADVVDGVLASHELNRLREQELRQEFAPPPAQQDGDPTAYLQKWNRVILSQALETVDGAMMPVAYWYEDFMPKLLAAFSVSSPADIESNTVADEAALDAWFAQAKAAGEFSHYGQDVDEGFQRCTADQKLRIKQAWRLTSHYLNGVQKRRERLEFGRESGMLSQYVSFLDVYLGRSDVRDAQMRISFPYYIGPAVWRFFHTTAEIVASQPAADQAALVAMFKHFFKLFAALYPCPYCRHHLNAYVVQNREVEMYPVEYLLLGQDADPSNFLMSIDEKLAAVADGESLRLFLWKLHNTVSSSIARSEEWYHRDDKAFYTTRYWPSIDSELARAHALKQISIATDRIMAIYGLLKPVARLASVRLQLQELLEKGDRASLEQACAIARDQIQSLEEAVTQGSFLQDTYRFDPDLVDEAPAFTPDEEAFSRSNLFIEV